IIYVFDQKTFTPWKNQAVSPTVGLYNSLYPECAPSRMWNFEFPNTKEGRNNAYNFLKLIPDGDFVVVRNQVFQAFASNQYASDWLNDELTYGTGNSMYTELKTQGFEEIDSINKVRVFSFVYKKNRSTEHTPKYVYSMGHQDPIYLSVDAYTPDSIGTIISPLFGKAKDWHQLHWQGST